MSSDDVWRPFREVMEAPFAHARAWKQATGRKAVGHLLPDVPEEIIHGAGALPLAIEGAGVQISAAQAHVPGYVCSHALGALELGLRGTLDVLDGMIIPYVCDTTRNLLHTWLRCFPTMPSELLRLPKRMDYPGAREYLRAEFVRFFDQVKKITGSDAGPERLSASIGLYNRSRARLREAYRLQRDNPEIWSAKHVGLLFASALRAPREVHLSWMDALPWNQPAQGTSRSRVPIYVRGKVWDPPGIMGLFDELGMVVAEDEIITGFRSVAVDAPQDTDPFDALCERHLKTVPYAGYHLDPEIMVTKFVDRVRASRAKGVLFLNPKFCEAAGFDTPDFQKALEGVQVPALILETSARGVSSQQIRLRLEAFREMIAGDLP